MVLAEGRPYVVALLTVDPEALRQFATGHNITTENLDELVQHPVVLARVEELVAGANARLSRPEQIKKYAVLSETWTPQTGQLTATMKLRRNVIERAYHDLVAVLYGDPPHRQGSEQ
jgi:long-chain acyl-CoA synthetase